MYTYLIAYIIIVYSIIIVVVITQISNSIIVYITLSTIWNVWTIILIKLQGGGVHHFVLNHCHYLNKFYHTN